MDEKIYKMSKTVISTTNNDDRGYTYSMEIPKIILFGDSITQGSFDPEKKGFGCYVTHRFARRADVVNRGLVAILPDGLYQHYPMYL